ncbi:hypothetical protein N9948_01140 [bacterium]|nr:hypothetical protein [bacterium]
MNKNPSFNMRKTATLSKGFSKQGSASGGINESGHSDFYSPVLSKDFLELPQNLKERRAWYRFFYSFNEIVRRSIDLHSELPLSKIRLGSPVCKDPDRSQYILAFYQNMVDRIGLFNKLLAIAHEYYLMGSCYIFLEDGSDSGPQNDPLFDIDDELQMPEEAKQYKEKYDKVNPDYQGWERLQILPPDMVRISRWRFTDKIRAELLVPQDTQNLMRQLSSNPHADGNLDDVFQDMPEDLKRNIQEGNTSEFETNPYGGSHLAEILRKTGDYEEAGSSILDCCLRSLLMQDKMRQSISQTLSRHMTPMRVVSAPKTSFDDIEFLREQIDAALVDPDYTIITNYEVDWNEMGADGRLPSLGEEYAELEKKLSMGLGVTPGLLTGESPYGGERISLEIINNQYMLFREVMQDFVETHVFKPVALKKGFWEYDKFGNKKLIYPKLSFTRLAIRDNDAVFNQMFDLYSKGSIPLSYILDLLGLDVNAAKEEMEKDLMTVNDNRFNDILNALAQPIADQVSENTDLAKKVAKYLNLGWKEGEDPPEDEADKERF